MIRPRRVFGLGRIMATPGALAALEAAGERPETYLGRHAACDWGSVNEEDAAANEAALEDGSRLLSSYRLPDGETVIWVVTEADRSATTLLLPSEY